MNVYKIVCVSLAVGLVGCAAESAQPVTVTQSLSKQGQSPSLSGEVLPEKTATPVPTMNVLEPDADAVRAHVSSPAPKSLTPSHLETLQASPLPVLFPSALTPEQWQVAIPTSGPHWYAISWRDDTHTVYIQGVRTSMEHPKIELDQAGDELAQAPYVLSRTHQVITLAFERFGLGYHIDISCAEPETDVRCTQEDYARELFKSMTLMQLDGGDQ